MRLLIFADLHLDATFRWAHRDTARRRRQALRDTLRRIVKLSDEVKADAILCAGDLYEHERFNPQTRTFLRDTFASTERRILIAPGNHDWYGSQSLFAQCEWPRNVHIFRQDRLTPIEIASGLTIWGAGFRAPTRKLGFLDDFAVDRSGVHLGLFHGSERSTLRFEEKGKTGYAPFDAGQVERAGLHHAFVGHYHQPRDEDFYTYPGNPDPLTFGESGERGAVIAEVHPDGRISRERRSVAISKVRDVEIDVTGSSTVDEVRDRVREALKLFSGSVRLVLAGEIPPDLELDPNSLEELKGDLEELVITTRNLHTGYDLESISGECTVRGLFVRMVREAPDLDDEERHRVLLTGLRALDGREDLEVH